MANAFKSRPVLVTMLIGVALLSFLVSLSAGLHARMARAQSPSATQITYLPNHDTLDFVSLGYKTIVTDLIWLRALQVRGTPREAPLVVHYGKAMLHMDPDFEPAYKWSSTNALFAPGRVTKESVHQANWFLERGMEHFPDNAYYPYTMGLHWAFYLPAETDQDRDMKKDRAVEYLQLSLQRPSPPKGTVLLIAGILRAKDDDALQLEFLEQAYLMESNPDVRRSLESTLRSSVGDKKRRGLERTRRLRQHWLSQGFSYLDYGLAYHVGERMTFLPATLHDADASPL